MSDTLIFTVGFTDSVNADWALEDPKKQGLEDRTVYNLRKMVPEVEKWSASWEIDMSLKHNQILFHNWESVIRTPHLRMCNIKIGENDLIPEYKNTSYLMEFINMIPVKDFKHDVFDWNTDTEHLTHTVDWGSLYVNVNEMLAVSTVKGVTHLRSFLHSDQLTDLPEVLDMELHPRFGFEFTLNTNGGNRRSRNDNINFLRDDVLKKYQKYKSDLEARGFTETGVLNQCINGSLQIGKLLTDPIDVVENTKESPYICRASLTKPE